MPKKLSVRNATILTPFPFFVTVKNRVIWMHPLKNFINHAYKHKTCKFTSILKKNKAHKFGVHFSGLHHTRAICLTIDFMLITFTYCYYQEQREVALEGIYINCVWKILVRNHSWLVLSSFLFPVNIWWITQLYTCEASKCSSLAANSSGLPPFVSSIIVNSFSHIKASYLSLMRHTTT